MNEVVRLNDERIDELEVALMELPRVECQLVHRFTPGMYIRELTMPKDAIITSKIHNTCHPFTISKGKAAVSIDGQDWEEFEAPFTGITMPGTRRVLAILENTVWTTYHSLPDITGEENNLTEEEINQVVANIEDMVLFKRENVLLSQYKKELQ